MILNEKHSNSIKPAGIPTWLVVLVDIAMANLGLYCALLLISGELQGFQIGTLIFLFPLVSMVTVFFFSSLGLYSRQRGSFMVIFRALLTGVIGLTFCSLLFAFWTRILIFERSLFLSAPLFQLILLLGWRIILWRLELWIHGQKKLLIVGNPVEVEQVIERIIFLPRGLFTVIKVLPVENIEQLPHWLNEAEAVMITGAISMDTKNRVIRNCFDHNMEVYLVPDLYEIILTRATRTQVHDIPMIECHDIKLTFTQVFIKRILDLCFAIVLLVLTLPVILLAALLVKLTSTGPVIYAQERVGFRGQGFVLYKLRTMIVDAEDSSGPVLSTEEDDRVTPVGRYLRASRIDELPQLYNVLRGDLSMVGPRPERPYFVEQFQQELEEYTLRHQVKPGITGLAQVNGFYSTNTSDKLRYDLYYIFDYSLLNDFKILLMTVPTIFNRDAAKGISPQIAKNPIKPVLNIPGREQRPEKELSER